MGVYSFRGAGAGVVKTSSGSINALRVVAENLSQGAWFKLYDKASPPVPGTDTPAATLYLAPWAPINLANLTGLSFVTGIAYAVTGDYPPADATAAPGGVIAGSFFYS